MAATAQPGGSWRVYVRNGRKNKDKKREKERIKITLFLSSPSFPCFRVFSKKKKIEVEKKNTKQTFQLFQNTKILTQVDLATGLDGSSRLPWTWSFRRLRSSATGTGSVWRLERAAWSCASGVAVVGLSRRSRFRGCPKVERSRKLLLLSERRRSRKEYFQLCRLLTAGKAKKEMPKRAQKEAIILPGQVIGTVSP